jgi:hypothetical protein
MYVLHWQDTFLMDIARFVGLAEDPQVLAVRAPELFGVCLSYSPAYSILTCDQLPDDRSDVSAGH